ncbi:MAG: leucine-rich repeat domain-containing protein [Candidatus Thorarchaeota archaeon]|nr:leucine-rich repeat domain-containing protein [Candidatus Thorarchaeota archaeon]
MWGRKVVLKYSTSSTKSAKSSRKESLDKVSFPRDVENIDLGTKFIKRIDLSGLRSCSNLRVLNLEYNLFSEIDLEPLRRCKKLEVLKIGGNNAEGIDFAPLSSCPNLREIEITFRGRVSAIDLAPLNSCTNLENLALRYGRIPKIDLQPLEFVSRLQSLDLELNDLQGIDLMPLASCPDFRRLVLSNNKLRHIDLEPLSSCKKLQELYLSYNRLESINLEPLSACINLQRLTLRNNDLVFTSISALRSCSRLQELNMEHNNIIGIDLSPLGSLQSIQSLRVCEPNAVCIKLDSDSWTPFWAIASARKQTPLTDPLKIFRIQYALLSNLDQLDLGMVDSNILEELCAIPPATPFDQAKEAVSTIVVEKMCEQIDRGGTTFGLDVEKLLEEGKHADLIMRAEQVNELRHEEMTRVKVPVESEPLEEYSYFDDEEFYCMYDLGPLWLTEYGHRILKTLRMPLTTDDDGLEEVTKALKELGYDIQVTHEGESMTKDALKEIHFDYEITEEGGFNLNSMTKGMQELIWDIVKSYQKRFSQFRPKDKRRRRGGGKWDRGY